MSADPTMTPPSGLPSRLQLFWAKVKIAENGCWIWTGALDHGYGKFTAESRRAVRAHRWAYENFVEPVDSDLALDHLCREKACVNPAHLEPVTAAENTSRWNRLRTHCKRGHEFSPDNIYLTRSGKRQCRTCRQMHSENWAAKRSRVA